MAYFQYHSTIVGRFPNLIAGVIRSSELRNGPTPTALQEIYRSEQQAVLARLGQTPLSEIPSLAAWRSVFRAFGVDPTQYRSAPEALLRRLTKKGDIPSINCLVDIGNLISIRYALPVAVFDMRHISWPMTVHIAQGTEPFQPLDAAITEYPNAGEVIFTDQLTHVHARRWCWRQSAVSAARDDTTAVLVTVEAHHDMDGSIIRAALADLQDLLWRYANASVDSAILKADKVVY